MDNVATLLIGGRAGVGKTTVAWEVSALLQGAGVRHALVEGDYLGQVHPAPDGDPHRSQITADNLAAVWANFARCGYRRLVYTNTVSVLPEEGAMFERAMGADVRIVRVLLTASDEATYERLRAREIGGGLDREFANSKCKSRLLDERAHADAKRIETDGRSVADIAREVAASTGWVG